MKRNLILSLLACGASLTLSPAIHAQEAAPAPVTTGTEAGGEGHHHRGGGDMLARLTKELDLTADQQEKVKPILETQHSAIQAAHQDTSLSQQDRMSKIKDARETANSAITALLTDDQKTKFAAMQEKWQAHRHGGGQGAENSQPAAAPTATP